MKLIKVTIENGTETFYFSSKAKAAKFMNIQQQNINYYLYKGKTPNGWLVDETDDPEVRNGDIDNIIYSNELEGRYQLIEGTNRIVRVM